MALNTRPNPDSGGRGGGGGGGTTGGGGSPANPSLLPVSGGVSGLTSVVVAPGIDNNGDLAMLFFDTDNFDTEADSVVQFRIEESEGVQVQINRLRIKYRNLGICTITVELIGMFSSALQTITLGNPTVMNGTRAVKSISDNRIYNAYVDFVFTDESPQVVITRPAGNGPLSIISITLLGTAHKPDLE